MSSPTLVLTRIRDWLPTGAPLPEEEWNGRHRGFLIFLVLQAVGLVVFGVIRGFGVTHSLLEGSVVGVAAVLAAVPRFPRTARAVIVTGGLMTASAILVHFSGGTIEAHFHFFVMVILVTLYQSWIPFLLSIAYVILHHGIMGSVSPDSVYNHGAAIRSPFTWALIHGAFIVAASIAGLIVWKRNEVLRAREQEQRSLSHALDQFAGWVAHDLKAPLSTIKGAMLATASLEDEEGRRRLLEIIDRQTDRAFSLVSNLLELARASGVPRFERVDLADVVGELKEDFGRVTFRVEGSLPIVWADRISLKQAIKNLVANAIIHGSRGDAHPEVSVRVDSLANSGWRIYIGDRGPGLSTDEAESIFEPFRQGSAGRSGSGLGLAIVAATARSHGGDAGYEPRPGGGSLFWILLPRPSPAAVGRHPKVHAATG